MKFYTLIHISKGERSLHNNSFVTSFKDQINLYFTCAKQLHYSLKAIGIELIVLTNDKEFLTSVSQQQYEIEITELNFTLEVPSGVNFYSAHFKIEVYKYLSALNQDYVGLIDCDIVCINPIPESFKNIIEYKMPLYYDITEQVTPAYSETRIIADKQKVTNLNSVGLWAGGEFIAGPPDFFEKLYLEIHKIKAGYFKNIGTLHHQSDEVLTSVAIEEMIIKGDLRILDAGAFSIVARYWSPKTLHVQKPLSAYTKHFLLHMPSDKKFITQLKPEELKGEAFFKKYKQHLFKARLLENAFSGIKPYVKKVRKKLQN